ncbi:RICIN domain-containing protein [Nonomuraea typhae]|uniref:RICIN domain-containing protein n=1 Tax=Nonomuraea typhae TaxID=2603600 RepID=A0ABW7YYI7_9ACTN
MGWLQERPRCAGALLLDRQPDRADRHRGIAPVLIQEEKPGAPANAEYTIAAVHSGKRLEVGWASQNNGAELLQQDCAPSAGNHRWRLDQQPDGSQPLRRERSTNSRASAGKAVTPNDRGDRDAPGPSQQPPAAGRIYGSASAIAREVPNPPVDVRDRLIADDAPLSFSDDYPPPGKSRCDYGVEAVVACSMIETELSRSSFFEENPLFRASLASAYFYPVVHMLSSWEVVSRWRRRRLKLRS